MKRHTDQQLDALILSEHEPDPEFAAFRDQLPPETWAKKDLAAVRMGWEAHKMLRENSTQGYVEK